MRSFLFPKGTRVRVKRGHYPLDPDLVGRTGVVYDTSPYRPGKYEVVLDGESAVREFAEEELAPAEGETAPGVVPDGG